MRTGPDSLISGRTTDKAGVSVSIEEPCQRGRCEPSGAFHSVTTHPSPDRPAPRSFRKHGTVRKSETKRHRAKADNRQANRLNTNSALWKGVRRAVLMAEPLCRHCAEVGRVTVADSVDHIDNNSFNNDPSNLQPLCRPCHARKTIECDGGFGREGEGRKSKRVLA